MTIGEQIRTARLRQGWSIRKLSALCDVSVAVIHKLEMGGSVRPGSLEKVAAALELVVETSTTLTPAQQLAG